MEFNAKMSMRHVLEDTIVTSHCPVKDFQGNINRMPISILYKDKSLQQYAAAIYHNNECKVTFEISVPFDKLQQITEQTNKACQHIEKHLDELSNFDYYYDIIKKDFYSLSSS